MRNIRTNIVVIKELLINGIEPNIESWESLGFSFNGINSTGIFTNILLPEGWFLKKATGEIIDLQGNVRAKISINDGSLKMMLLCKYVAGYDFVDNDPNRREYYFGNKEEKIFVAGRVKKLPREKTDIELLMKRYQLEQEYQTLVEMFAIEYYPDYKNPLAYWDDKNDKVYVK